MTYTRPSLAAVLFDLDGALVDSDRLSDVALRELAVEYGASLSGAARVAMVGSDAATSMRITGGEARLRSYRRYVSGETCSPTRSAIVRSSRASHRRARAGSCR